MTPDPRSALHPRLREAAQGSFPPWTVASEARKAHMERVSDLMGRWAEARELSRGEVDRWAATGLLHDCLRDEDHQNLRSLVDRPFLDLPGKILHGPGAARKLQEEGVTDGEILHAIRYHTLGSADFGTVGLALYAADFLEPGRELREDWRAKLRERVPNDLPGVVKAILSARIRYLLDMGRPVRPETVQFWNRMSEGQPWASASET